MPDLADRAKDLESYYEENLLPSLEDREMGDKFFTGVDDLVHKLDTGEITSDEFANGMKELRGNYKPSTKTLGNPASTALKSSVALSESDLTEGLPIQGLDDNDDPEEIESAVDDLKLK